MVQIRFEGVKDLTGKLHKMANRDAVRTVVQKNGADLQRRMMRKADFTQGYQTGTTKCSIHLNIKDGGMTAEVGPETNYAPYLEVGTRFMAAQPFVRPALNEQEPIFIRDLEKLLEGK